MGNQQERFDLELSWLAGIIEGEGWISLSMIKSLKKTGKYYAAFTGNIGMTNTDYLIVNKVEEIFNKLEFKYRLQERPAHVGKDGGNRKAKKEISVYSRQYVIKLINHIVPYMIGEKKNRALKLLEFYKIRESKPKQGIHSKYGKEELDIYNSLYSYRGKTRSEIPNDYTFGVPFAEKDKDIV